jgi:hypothetical protein
VNHLFFYFFWSLANPPAIKEGASLELKGKLVQTDQILKQTLKL